MTNVRGDNAKTSRLRLIFTCCHPALDLPAQVALTLRTVSGLSTAQLAQAFLVPEPTMSQRLTRAEHKIRNAGIPHRVAADTDWAQIAVLHGHLLELLPTPVAELNRAVAVAMADGPQAGLDLADKLRASGTLEGYHLLAATRADLLGRLGRSEEAADAYQQALELATSDVEQRYLACRMMQLAGRR